jgi:thiol:disulfide interchange protein DsbA
MGSPGVAAKVAQARELLKAYHVHGVPTFIVDGKFLTSERLAGGTEQVIQVVDHLVKLAREERLR